MKHTKKFVSLLLTLVMVLAMASTTFAADATGTITINNPVNGETYNAYLMFELESYNTNTGAYAYKITEDWREFVTTGYGKAYFAVDDQDYVRLKDGVTIADNSETAATIAKKAVAYAASKKLTPAAILKKDNNYTVTDLTLGYYVVDSSLGALCGLTTTEPSATISEKNEVPVPDKTVKEDSDNTYGDSNTAQIGDTVEFKTVIHAKKGAQNYVLHDQMEEGLTLDQNSITVKVGETELSKGTHYTVDFNVPCQDENGNDAICDFEITFYNDYLDNISGDTNIIVTYKAVLNEKAKIADATNDNDTKLDYGDGSYSEWDTTTTMTFMFDIIKTDSSFKVLDGAEFELFDQETNGSKINLVEIEKGLYRVATSEEVEESGFSSAVIKTVNGKATVKGLDFDSKTSYWLEETKAPAGYNKLSGRVEVKSENSNLTTTMDKDDNTWGSGDGGVHITNNTGAELPSTGGMGTTIFYIIGSVLVLAAVVLLIVRKRMSDR